MGGSLAKWVPAAPADSNGLDRRMAMLELRRIIVDRVSSWEELEATAREHEATAEMLGGRLSACEHVEPWQVRRWEAQRDKALAGARKCRRTMEQCEHEVIAFAARYGDGQF